MGLFSRIKKLLTPKPDIIYVRAPTTSADEKLSRALKHLHEKSEKQKLLDTINRTQNILEDIESRIDIETPRTGGNRVRG